MRFITSSQRTSSGTPSLSSLGKRMLAVGLVTLVGIGMSGCNSESSQRKAFIDFLQTRIVQKSGVSTIPNPNAEERKSFGDYAAQYQVILDFNNSMDKTFAPEMQKTQKALRDNTPQGIMQHRKEIDAIADSIAAAQKAVDTQLASADAAHAAMKQPEDLKQVYDKAYDKIITKPAVMVDHVFPVFEASMKSVSAFADFLDQHRDGIKFIGSQMQVDDPKLQNQINALSQDVNKHMQELMGAQKQMVDMLKG